MDLFILGEAWKLWFIVAIVFFIIEGSNPGTFAIFFGGIGALTTAVICFVSEPFANNVVLQILTFSVMTLSSLFLLRTRFVRLIQGETKFSGDSYVGKQARTLTALRQNSFDGRVFYEGTEWPAMLSEECREDIPADSMVEIVKREGLTFLVKPQRSSGGNLKEESQ